MNFLTQDLNTRPWLLRGLIALMFLAAVVVIVHRRSRTYDPHCPICGFRASVSRLPIINLIVRRRTTTGGHSCVNTLRQIDGAQQQWALEQRQPDDAVPTWSDIAPYFLPGSRRMKNYQLTIRVNPGAVWRDGWATLSSEESGRYIRTNGPVAFCVSGGTYEIHCVREPPTCSMGGLRKCGHKNSNHTLD